jgi:hypothetical protein
MYKEEVLGFKVAVHDFMAVQVSDAPHQLPVA